ncbi:MAG: hypothetical protein ACR2NA_11240 [Solirubrobacterales bacterium]
MEPLLTHGRRLARRLTGGNEVPDGLSSHQQLLISRLLDGDIHTLGDAGAARRAARRADRGDLVREAERVQRRLSRRA